jgi:simple sugar transport system permease protein
MKTEIKKIIENFGLPRIIVFLFLLFLLILTPFSGLRFDSTINDIIVRFGMNAVLVLSLIPMVKSGCGLNFGLQLSIIPGLLGAVISIEIGLRGFIGFFVAIGIAVFFAIISGYLYGLLLNKVKGNEMVVATYVGFSIVSFMCIMWLLLPFKSADMIWPYGGTGLRPTISNEGYWFNILTNFLKINIGEYLAIPTGNILFFGLLALLLWGFFRTKLGTSITITGINPDYARSCGINIDNMRIISVIVSTIIGAIGIIVYQEGFGFIQLYLGPLYMSFPAIAAILIGGATVDKASISNVIIGVLLFQGISAAAPSVVNNLLKHDIAEPLRIVITNGMIVYALTRVVRSR